MLYACFTWFLLQLQPPWRTHLTGHLEERTVGQTNLLRLSVQEVALEEGDHNTISARLECSWIFISSTSRNYSSKHFSSRRSLIVMEIWLTIKSERGWSKCSYLFRPSHSGSRRTESTQDHCSPCLPEEVFIIPVYYIPWLGLAPVIHCGQPESCNKSL